MEYNPEKELVKTFDKLGVNLGKWNSNVIEGWFDVDPQLNSFLIWMSNNLTEENLIYSQEIEEYENNTQKNLLPSQNNYQNELEIISERYPGIFDISENEFEIECLEDELKMLINDKQELDDILQSHENLHIQEKLALAELEKHKIKSINELAQAEEECLQMSCNLDELNKKLYDQLIICNEKLSEYEYPSTSTHISNISLNKYYTQYRDVISYFDLLEKREFIEFPKLQSAVLICSKLDASIFQEKTNNSLTVLKERLLKSIQNKNYKEAVKEQLQAELKFLDNFNIYQVMNCLRSKHQLEGSIKSKLENYDVLSLELENLTAKVSEKYIDYPSIAIAEQEAKILQNKICSIKAVEDVFMNIFSYHTLLYLMIMINNTDITRSDTFLRSVYNYISNNLTKCELRIGSMDTIIKQYKLYEETPFEQRCVLLQVLQGLLSGNNEKLNIDFLIKFQNEHCFANFDESLQFRGQVSPIEKSNQILKSFLINGPTSECITFPFKLHEIFMKIDYILNMKKNVVDTAVTIWNDAEKQISKNEWFKYKRQLWMNFLLRPVKVTAIIEEIEKEIQKIITDST